MLTVVKRYQVNATPAHTRSCVTSKAATSNTALFNRELSFLEFHARVVEEARDPSNPLLERLKFLFDLRVEHRRILHDPSFRIERRSDVVRSFSRWHDTGITVSCDQAALPLVGSDGLFDQRVCRNSRARESKWRPLH